MAAETSDTVLRESLRDVGTSRSFRRDLFRRVSAPMGVAEHWAHLVDWRFVSTAAAIPEELSFNVPRGKMTIQGDLHPSMLQAALQGPFSVGQLSTLPPRRDQALPQALQALAASGA
mgnify:FL=1